VVDVGGSFSITPRTKSGSEGSGKDRCQGPPARSPQPQVQQRLHLSALSKELEIMGHSGTLDRTREGAEKLRELAVKAASRDSWLRPAAEAR